MPRRIFAFSYFDKDRRKKQIKAFKLKCPAGYFPDPKRCRYFARQSGSGGCTEKIFIF